MLAQSTAAPAIPAPLPEGGARGGFTDRNTHTNHHTTAEPQFIDFHPTKEAASDILCAIVDPDETLSDIARRFGTTLDALADWLDTPPVLQRIEKMKRIAAMRDELILTAHYRAALAVLVSLINAHQHDEQHIAVDPQNLRAVTQRDRRRAAARLASSQLIRLARAGWRGRAGSSPLYHGDASDPQSTPISPPSSPTPAHPSTPSPSPTPDITTNNIETPPTHPTSAPECRTQCTTGGQAASATRSNLCAMPCDPVFHHAASTSEAG